MSSRFRNSRRNGPLVTGAVGQEEPHALAAVAVERPFDVRPVRPVDRRPPSGPQAPVEEAVREFGEDLTIVPPDRPQPLAQTRRPDQNATQYAHNSTEQRRAE